ncbi:ornithine cyclodeaminase family protein [uncultured Roseovarius sp.]|uniref:ornithine cyclodeaminase family protein n=1 Tax=uncultured Roseovarius sp. TaxID=293344 RepID=UPI00260AC79E|nr:ornithine cyclodeaminase family protein [uncultured Roseovarius sp.]
MHVTSHSDAPVILDSAAVDALLPQMDVQAELQVMFRAMGQGKAVQPAQSVTEFPGKDGDFITYLGAIEEMGVFGAKLSPYIVTDAAPIITAWTALMSMQTGQPLAWCDAARLTTERTAGTTALAVDFLATATANHLAIIGSGAVAQAHLRHVLNLRPWTRISVYSPALEDDQARLAQWHALSENVTVSEDAKSCISGADVVMLCTSSGTPVIDPADIGKPAFITSISTNAPAAHEVPPGFLPEADVYCDYAPTTPGAAAEMRLAEAEHGWSPEEIKGDLAMLACGEAPLPSYERPVYFRSIGLGLEDIAMAYGIWKLAQAQRG